MLTPAERMAGSSLDPASLPATRIDAKRELTGEVMRMVSGMALR